MLLVTTEEVLDGVLQQKIMILTTRDINRVVSYITLSTKREIRMMIYIR